MGVPPFKETPIYFRPFNPHHLKSFWQGRDRLNGNEAANFPCQQFTHIEPWGPQWQAVNELRKHDFHEPGPFWDPQIRNTKTVLQYFPQYICGYTHVMQVKRYINLYKDITPVTHKIRKGNDIDSRMATSWVSMSFLNKQKHTGALQSLQGLGGGGSNHGCKLVDLYIPLDFKYWMNLKRWKAAGRLEHGSLHTHPRKPNA